MVQLSGLPSLFASSSKPGFSSRLPVGGVVTVKLLVLVAVPTEVLTLIGPLLAPLGTVVVIWVSAVTLHLAAAPLEKVTVVVPLKLLPLMVTEVPTGPLVGLKELIVGGGVTVKLLALVAVPAGVVTRIGPEVAPVGTGAVSWGSALTVKLAAGPLRPTAVVPVELL